MGTTMGDDALAKLKEHGIIPCPLLASFVCTHEKCGCEVAFCKKLFIQHLKRKEHNVRCRGTLEALWKCANQCSSAFPSEHANRESYRTGGWSVGVLPRISGLPIVQGRKCTECDKLLESDSGYRNHLRSVHKKSLSRTEIALIPAVDCQALTKKPSTKLLFRIQGDAQDSSAQRQGNSNAESALMHYDAGETSAVGSVCDREKSSFVSLARCHDRLEQFELCMEEAYQLSRFPVQTETDLSPVGNKLGAIINGILGEARDVSISVASFRSTLLDIATPGTTGKTEPFKFLDSDERGKSSQVRYANSARVVVLVACRVFLHPTKYPGITMSESMRADVGRLFSRGPTGDSELREIVHRILVSIFFEKSSIAGGTGKLFSSVIAACLCVTKGQGGGTAYFQRGLQVGREITGILYAVSCCAVLEITRYSDACERARVEEKILSSLQPGAKVGLSVFVDFRSICRTVREEENSVTLYRACTRHVKCGIVKGTCFPISALGTKFREMQEALRCALFKDLLYSEQLPATFKASCSDVVDDDTCHAPGYWALADRRNEVFLRECRDWVRSKLRHVLNEEGLRKKWVQKVKSVVPLLLTVMHLSGGAPGRGTEIGSYAVRNTAACQRAIYFHGEEIMVVPSFCKTRSRGKGRMRFLCRHLDIETSYLFKAFFILIHPAFVVCCRKNENESRENRGLDEEEAAIRDKLCLGVMKPKEVSTAIGNCFAKYRIPFNFQVYRHWQRGYVKMVGARRMLQLLENMDVFDDDEDLDGIGSRASLEQAGHSSYTATFGYAQSKRASEMSLKGESERIEMFRKASHDWHRELGLRKGIEPKSSPRNSVQGECAPSGRLSLEPKDLETLGNTVARSLFQNRSSAMSESTVGCVSQSIPERLYVEVCNAGGNMLAENSTVHQPGLVLPRFDALKALGACLQKPGCEFRSELQRQAMEAVAENRTDLAIILATGSGKTAVVMGPILYEQGCTLWIAPLRALLRETKARLLKAGIDVVDLDALEQEKTRPGNVILVGPEDLEDDDVMRGILRLSERRVLNRIVFDEAHIPLLSSSYRHSMSRLCALADTRSDVHRVLLTATAPCNLLQEICKVLEIDYDGVDIIRGDPCRPNLQISVSNLGASNPGALIASVSRAVKRTAQKLRASGTRSGRILVTCLTIAHCDHFEHALSLLHMEKVCVLKYHSKVPQESLEACMKKWEKPNIGTLTVLCATDGFTTGTDAPDIRQIVIAGGSRTLVDFWQACGRGGRDGKLTDITVLFNKQLCIAAGSRDSASTLLGRACGSFVSWAENRQGACRRKSVEQFLEGVRVNRACSERTESGEAAVALCDVCAQGGGNSAYNRVDTDPRGCMHETRRSTGVYDIERDVPQVTDPENGALTADPSASTAAAISVSSKRRREEAIEHSKRQRHNSTATFRGQEERMRNWGNKLKTMCMRCLFEETRKDAWNTGTERYFRGVVAQCGACVITQCFWTVDMCMRCMQDGHHANSCWVLKSVQRTSKRKCRACFLKNVKGRSVHEGAEFAREGICPFEPLTRLALLCYRDPQLRRSLNDKFANAGFSGVSDACQFAAWLLEDKVGQSAKLFEVIEWVHGALGLKNIGLE